MSKFITPYLVPNFMDDDSDPEVSICKICATKLIEDSENS